MDIQVFPNGITIVTYGNGEPYQSPLKCHENNPSMVSYQCSQTGGLVGKVYQTEDEKWWAASAYLEHWMPIEVFTKYNGFLLVNRLYHENNEH